MLLAHLLTNDERLTVNRLFGVLFALCGVFLLVGPERFKELSPVVTSAGMLISSTVMMLPLALILEKPWTLRPSAITWGGLLVLGLFGSAMPLRGMPLRGIANLIYFRILAVAGATNISLVTFLIPITALLLGIFVLGERLDWTAFTGMALIFTGLAATDGRLFSQIRWR